MSKHLSISDDQFEEMRRSGSPLVVSTEEGAEIVVQDAAAYRRMIEILDELDLAQSARICSERWRALQNGSDPGVPADEFFADLKRRLRRTG